MNLVSLRVEVWTPGPWGVKVLGLGLQGSRLYGLWVSGPRVSDLRGLALSRCSRSSKELTVGKLHANGQGLEQPRSEPDSAV